MTDNEITLEQTMALPLIESSGGLVIDSHHRFLLIFKRGKWDLPKGRIEGNQSASVTAIREVEEETGLDAGKLEIKGKLVPTWHTTTHEKNRFLKKTHWFLMHYTDDDVHNLSPQIEEGIIECRWVHLSEFTKYRKRLRPRIAYVLDFWHQNLAYVPRS